MSIVHTPAPWAVHEFRNDDGDLQTAIVDVEDRTVLARLDIWEDEAKPQMEGNARLIAAAPELLGALQWLIPLIEQTFPKQQEVWLADARAVIEKVRGEG